MKIRDIFEMEQIEDKQYMVCLDSTVFAGMIELNETAAFIVSCLKEDTNIEEISRRMTLAYDVSLEEAHGGVEGVISQLEQMHFLEA